MSRRKRKDQKEGPRVTSVQPQQGMERGEVDYYLPLDFETALLYSVGGLGWAYTEVDRMYPVSDSTGDVERIASIIDEDSPEFEEAARDIQKRLEELIERFPEYRQ